MPDFARDTRRRLVVVEFIDIWIVSLLADRLGADVFPERPEILPEAHVVFVADLLVTEKYDEVLREGVVKL